MTPPIGDLTETKVTNTSSGSQSKNKGKLNFKIIEIKKQSSDPFTRLLFTSLAASFNLYFDPPLDDEDRVQ